MCNTNLFLFLAVYCQHTSIHPLRRYEAMPSSNLLDSLPGPKDGVSAQYHTNWGQLTLTDMRAAVSYLGKLTLPTRLQFQASRNNHLTTHQIPMKCCPHANN